MQLELTAFPRLHSDGHFAAGKGRKGKGQGQEEEEGDGLVREESKGTPGTLAEKRWDKKPSCRQDSRFYTAQQLWLNNISAMFEILGPKRIGVMTSTCQGHVTSSVT